MRSLLSKSDQTYLANKHRGGQNNQKGNQYEAFYTVNKLASLLNVFANELDDVLLQAQVPMAFVDDLLITMHGHKVYHQIKDVINLRWSIGKTHPLSYDYKKQVSLCKKKGESFKLKLIHSHNSDKLNTLPRGTRKYTEVVLFPAYSSLNIMVLSDVVFQDNLRKLLYNGTNLPLDELNNLAMVILGCWCSEGTSSTIDLRTIDTKVAQNRVGYRSNVTTTIQPACQSILDRLVAPGYTVSGNLLCMKFGGATVTIPWNNEIQQKIIDTNPMNPLDLFSL